tara:strand:- start:1298 stop:1822 length:525 start_codon:yes stop_codon:yes gene_type:complete
MKKFVFGRNTDRELYDVIAESESKARELLSHNPALYRFGAYNTDVDDQDYELLDTEDSCTYCDGKGNIWNNADPTSGQRVDCPACMVDVDAELGAMAGVLQNATDRHCEEVDVVVSEPSSGWMIVISSFKDGMRCVGPFDHASDAHIEMERLHDAETDGRRAAIGVVPWEVSST